MHRNKLRTVVPAVLAAATAALVLGQPAQAAPSAAGDMQLITTDGGNGLAHTIRGFWGGWQQFGHIGGYSAVTELTSTYHDGEENAFFLQGNTLAHLIRHDNGTWNLLGSTPNGAGVTQLSTTDVGGKLTLVAVRDGAVQTTTEQADGTWTPWSAVPSDKHAIVDIAAVALGDTLRVVELDDGHRNIGEFERSANGAWTSGGWTTTAPDSGETATEIAAAQVGGELQIAAVETDGSFNSVFHGVLGADGTWSPFASLAGAIGHIDGNPVHVAVAPWEGALQLAYSASNGGLYHTVRYQNGDWQDWGYVQSAAGSVNAGPLTMAANPVN